MQVDPVDWDEVSKAQAYLVSLFYLYLAEAFTESKRRAPPFPPQLYYEVKTKERAVQDGASAMDINDVQQVRRLVEQEQDRLARYQPVRASPIRRSGGFAEREFCRFPPPQDEEEEPAASTGTPSAGLPTSGAATAAAAAAAPPAAALAAATAAPPAAPGPSPPAPSSTAVVPPATPVATTPAAVPHADEGKDEMDEMDDEEDEEVGVVVLRSMASDS